MNKKKLLVCALALSTVGVLSNIDTAGVLPFSVKTVHAEITRIENHEVKSKITPGSECTCKIFCIYICRYCKCKDRSNP